MINNNKILKAVYEGIKSGFKFSPDNIVDDSSYINFDNSKINAVESLNIEMVKKQIENLKYQIVEKDFVDLGLPSGNKWAKFNIGASCGNNYKSWEGNYYAWGEIQTKNQYNDSTYQSDLLSKYNGAPQKLKFEDDIATQTYKQLYNKIKNIANEYNIDNVLDMLFRMPDKDDFEELRNHTLLEWEENYNDINGLNGIKLNSKYNTNHIFIPVIKISNNFSAKQCALWSRELSSHQQAYYLHYEPSDYYIDHFNDGLDKFDIYNVSRFKGIPVRAIYEY